MDVNDGPARESPREVPRSELPIGRAAFLGMIALGVGGVFVAPRIVGTVNSTFSAVVPDSITSAVSGGGWRIYNVAPPMPTFRPASYSLRIDGLVEHPTTLSWSQVAAMPGTEQISDFHCVTGWTVPRVHWEGIRPATITALVAPMPSARYVTFFSLEEPYVDQISLEQFRVKDVLVARHMDGHPLERIHGAPLRVVIPQMYGYKGVKWLSRIRFDAEAGLGYWEQRGYDVNAWVGRSNGIGA